MKIVTVVGARPQFIKAAVVSRAFRNLPGIKEVLVHTGQHYDQNMSEVFFQELDIPRPDYNLNIGSGTHGAQTGKMLEAIEEVLLDVKPDWVLVYGDTNSTLAGALAAAKLHIPVAHVEAGLRSFNRRMPEEINRVLTDHISELLFAPTALAVENLRREGIPEERVKLAGDVMYDAAHYYAERSKTNSCILERLGLRQNNYILATIHRAENTDNPSRLSAIFEGLVHVAREQRIKIIVPLHPRTKTALREAGLERMVQADLIVIEPVGYLDMVALERAAELIVTDSGGVQRKPFSIRCPVTLREETEWVESVELGWNRLVPPVSAKAVAAGLISGLRYSSGLEGQPYGDGHSAEKIVQLIIETCR